MDDLSAGTARVIKAVQSLLYVPRFCYIRESCCCLPLPICYVVCCEGVGLVAQLVRAADS